MLKLTTSLFCLFSLLITTFPSPVIAQTKEPPAIKSSSTNNAQDRNSPDLKLAVEQKSKEFNQRSAVFDPVKTERENAQQQAQKKGMSTTKKALLWTALAVGVAAVLFVVIKYGKDCLRTTPENCDLNDEYCTCAEYERRIPKGQ